MSPFWIVLIIVVLLVFFFIAVYNNLAKKRILVREGWSGIGTFLQQRNDMIPNLVETVKGYAVHESKTLQDVVKWRNKSVAATSNTEKMEASNRMNEALLDFFAVAEQYPDLKANTNFLALQTDLKEMEVSLNQSRRYYNGAVRDYNQAVAVFPSNLVAGMFGFTAEPFFQEEAGAGAVPKVSFN
ncbi:MAG: LemA family protein [Chitinophagaceae bacterium]|nr:LemA family protein [Chitinophagaceae bacterium]